MCVGKNGMRKSPCVLYWTIRRALQHTAVHCNALQHTATHCYTLLHTATHCYTLLHTAIHCNTLQHTATHCYTLLHTAPMRHPSTRGFAASTMSTPGPFDLRISLNRICAQTCACRALHCVALRCSVLQHHCEVPK